MPSYTKRPKRSKDGLVVRYVGRNRKGVPEKFRLGYDLDEADRRIRLLQALWHHMEEYCSDAKGEIRSEQKLVTYWSEPYLCAAKAIAKGGPPTLPKRLYETSELYVQRLAIISEDAGTKFEPTDPQDLSDAIYFIQRGIAEKHSKLSDAVGVPDATGRTVEEAVDAYEAALTKQHTLPNGSLEAWGKTRIDQLGSIRNYLRIERFGGRNHLILDLAKLTYEQCDDIYDVFRCRPPTIRSKYQKRMTPSSAKNLIKELGKFFNWLDGTDEFEWVEPSRFRSISKTPDRLTAEEQYERRKKKKQSIIPPEHLTTLFESSLPIERILMLLGLNCAFGAAEIGHLRTDFLDLDSAVIDGIRFKTGNETKHRLWPETVDGLRWALDRRRRQKPLKPEHEDVVFLTDRGKPLWHHSEKGNTSNGVSNIWNRLIKRVRKDDPAFPNYSFNKLRKTSATRILVIANAEIASMILAHRTISDDELLENYTLLPWEKLFKAQEKYRTELDDVISTGSWDEKRKTYIGVGKTKRIFELDDLGMPAPKIATELKVSLTTVYRHLQEKYGKRQSGRKSVSKAQNDRD